MVIQSWDRLRTMPHTVSQTELQQQQRYPTSTSENTFPIKFTNQVPPAPLAHDAFYHQRVTLRKTWSRFSEHITLQVFTKPGLGFDWMPQQCQAGILSNFRE